MATVADEFVQKFHSLEGITIGQRKKNLFSLFNQNAFLKDKDELLDCIIANLKPETFLESLFRVEFLIYFKRANELFDVLKEGDDIHVAKIIKQDWMFATLFNDVDAEELVNSILPCLSFSVRMKVLTKLSQNIDSAKFDKIFDAVATRYGISIARGLVAGCTPGKIKKFLTEYPMVLSVKKLKTIYKKDPDLTKFYFVHCRKYVSYASHNRFFKFLFTYNLPIYKYLETEYRGFMLTYGRRLTRKFVALNEDALIQNPQDFELHRLQNESMVKKMGQISEQLFANLFLSTKMLDYGFCRSNVIYQLPTKYHYNLIFNVLQNLCNKKLVDHPNFVNEEILKLAKHNDERALLARVQVNQGNYWYTKYLTVEESIPLIKEKIKSTSDVREKAKLIGELIETCYINGKDMNAFASVMKYILGHHKNDGVMVHSTIVDKVEDLFGFKNFTEELWNDLNELITIHALKHDRSSKQYGKLRKLPLLKFTVNVSLNQKFSYLNYLFQKKDISFDELMNECFYSDQEFPAWGTYDKNFEKHFLQFVLDDNANKILNKTQMEFNCKIIRQLELWNNCYADDQYSFYSYPFLLNTFNYMIKNSNYINHTMLDEFRSKIFTTLENSYRKEYLEIYWKRLEIFHCSNDFLWFLKFDPTIILENFDKFISTATENENLLVQLFIWYKVKKFTHLQLDKKSKEFCLSKINDKNYLEYKPRLVTCLSVLMKVENFIAFAELYKPVDKRLDLDNEEAVKLYNLQCYIAESFTNTRNYHVMPCLLNFCAGDYLKYSLRSLYSIASRTPENDIPQHCQFLAGKAVSVRKHALHLTRLFGTSKQVEEMLKLLNVTEKVLSLQKYVFSSAIKDFMKNPTPEMFEIVKIAMRSVSNQDEESHKLMLHKCDKVHARYKGLYFQCCWEYFEATFSEASKLTEYKDKLIHIGINDTEIIKSLPPQFVIDIIHKHLFCFEEPLWVSVIAVVVDFLLVWYDQSVIEAILKKFDETENWLQVYKIFKRFTARIMCDGSSERIKHFYPFLEYFDKKVNPIEHFAEYAELFFVRTKFELVGKRIFHELPEKIFVFLDHLHKDYGPLSLYRFFVEFRKNRSYFVSDYHPDQLIEILEKLLMNHPLPYIAIAVLNMISHVRKGTEYDKIIRKIMNIDDIQVQIILYYEYGDYIESGQFAVESMEVD